MSAAVVTGGASGIGREVVVRLRDAGHDVVVWDQTGGDIECDISDPAAVTAARARSSCGISPTPSTLLPSANPSPGLLMSTRWRSARMGAR